MQNANGWYTLDVPKTADNNGKYNSKIYDINPDTMVKIKVKVPATWTEPKLWAWRGNESEHNIEKFFAEFPGQALSKDGDWYSLEVPALVTWLIISHINSEGKTIQTTNQAVQASKPVWVIVKDDNSVAISYS